MQSTDIPSRITIAFAQSASGTYRAVIPDTTTTPGRASFTQGFGSINFIPIAGGGIPPFGADMNGILFDATTWLRWIAAGGPIPYNSPFSSTNSGYPKGALLPSATAGSAVWWLSTADNNTTDPDGGSPANWEKISYGTTYAGDPNGNVAGVAFGALGITKSMLWDSVNNAFWVCTSTGPASGGGRAVWVRNTAAVALPNSGVTAGSYKFTNLTVNAQGIITAASNGGVATNSTNGIVRPDGTSITINGSGQLSATTGGSGSVTNVSAGSFLSTSPGGGITTTGTVQGNGATANDIRAGTASNLIVSPGALAASAAFITLTDATSIAWNMTTGYNAKVTYTTGTTRTFAVPLNPQEGITYSLRINSGPGGITTTLPSCFNFGAAGAPAFSTGANKWDLITMLCVDAVTPVFSCSFLPAA
jgi:hypothetical protein